MKNNVTLLAALFLALLSSKSSAQVTRHALLPQAPQARTSTPLKIDGTRIPSGAMIASEDQTPPTGYLPTPYTFNVGTGFPSWKARAQPSLPGASAAGAVLNNFGLDVWYVLGGPDPRGGRSVESYLKVSDQWAIERSLPDDIIEGRTLSGVGGLLYAIGGRDSFGRLSNFVEVYDPVAGLWSTSPVSLPSDLAFHAAVVVDGVIHVLGGIDSVAATPTTLHISWDPAGAAGWVNELPLPFAVRDASAVLTADSSIVVIGGSTPASAPSLGSPMVQVLPSKNGAPYTSTPLPIPVQNHCSVLRGNTIYVLGGQNDSGALGNVFSLSPGGTWKEGAPLGTPRFDAAVAVLGGEIFVAGGRSGAGMTSGISSVEEYDPGTATLFLHRKK